MNQSKVYVGSLSYDVTTDDLQSFFGQYGDIEETRLITDRETGRSKGFAFITYTNQSGAQAALVANGIELQGRKIRVNIARDNNSGNSSNRRRESGGIGSRRVRY
ncbi:RNA-binding protein [Coxiella endosymbiont of Amblyomma sculptum]|uniref:RNA recognition motif domain-containing protein n=1 Tax=Coxiella endosymbiont of Amblyomma sculptum TaxID=2487929 RepID=UPI00132F161C|nr:RNA-binding protein [Coxiella endosymbiont of Amblyomma sculptum]QHG92590.1 RNA-binding protein [Coxiella endosymbiont of Amblyomma sculptum]